MANKQQVLELLRPERRAQIEQRLEDDEVSFDHFLQMVHLALINQLLDGDQTRIELSPQEHKLLAYVVAMETLFDREAELRDRYEQSIEESQQQGIEKLQTVNARLLELSILRGSDRLWEAVLDVVEHALNQYAQSSHSQKTLEGVISLNLYELLEVSTLLAPVREKTELFHPITFALVLSKAFGKVLRLEEAAAQDEFPLVESIRHLYQTNTRDRVLTALEPYAQGQDLEFQIQKTVLQAEGLFIGLEAKKAELEQLLR